MAKMSTVERVWQLADPIAKSLDLILWDVRFVKEGASWFLRIYIDSDTGVSLDECEAMSRALDPVLDEADPISQSYYLEVSSPGTERASTRPFHFESCLGEQILIRLIRPQDGRREYQGVLTGYEDGRITLDDNGASRTFDEKDTALCRLVDTFFGG